MAVSFWYKNESDIWVQGTLHAKDSSAGWMQGKSVFEKTGVSTWTEFSAPDLTPPAAPTYTMTNDAAAKTASFTITLPADADTVGGRIKMSATAYPSDPNETSSQTQIQPDGQPFWSWNGSPSSISVRTSTTLTPGTKYYVSVWAKDAAGNWSAPQQSNFTQPMPPAPTQTLVTKTAYVSATDSASYRASQGWRSDNNYVYQGSEYNFQGFWFYGTAIASMLAKAHSVTKIELYVQRVNSAHGVSGDATIMVGHHALSSQPSGSPGSNAITGEYNTHDLTRGEGKWATINSAWYSSFKSGSYRGFGMQYQTTTVTSSYYAYCYGKGTSSGKVKLTWTEYV